MWSIYGWPTSGRYTLILLFSMSLALRCPFILLCGPNYRFGWYFLLHGSVNRSTWIEIDLWIWDGGGPFYKTWIDGHLTRKGIELEWSRKNNLNDKIWRQSPKQKQANPLKWNTRSSFVSNKSNFITKCYWILLRQSPFHPLRYKQRRRSDKYNSIPIPVPFNGYRFVGKYEHFRC